MSVKEYKDSKPHTLEIHEVDRENGLIEWDIWHNDECKKVDWITDPEGHSIHVYECLVQFVIDGIGIEEIMRDHLGQKELVEGKWFVVGCSNYDDYNHESDSWLELYDEH